MDRRRAVAPHTTPHRVTASGAARATHRTESVRISVRALFTRTGLTDAAHFPLPRRLAGHRPRGLVAHRTDPPVTGDPPSDAAGPDCHDHLG
ncbi:MULTISPECIES: hypothetical protein [Rhodococcus]|uniref:hypothetical protein n=1 Tax=Rhodococcus TaxID=1827 RepID=UPI001ED8F715|nr:MULTISPECIES: hypothetical protein [Rhodococcus]